MLHVFALYNSLSLCYSKLSNLDAKGDGMQRQMPCCGAKLSLEVEATDDQRMIGEFNLIDADPRSLTFFCPAGVIASRLTATLKDVKFCPNCGKARQ